MNVITRVILAAVCGALLMTGPSDASQQKARPEAYPLPEIKKDCTTCHAAMPPASHQDATWAQDHPVQGATHMDLCTLCHGENACVDCHAKRGVNG